MPRRTILSDTIEEAVETIIPYLEDTSNAAYRVIYFDGWRGLAASAVLTTMAKEPPPSLVKRFNKIIHVDCSRWKSRRALQRTIVQELRLPRRVMDVLDRQDEEDDFRGVDEGSRAEIQDVGEEINRAMREHKCLLIFHNGSDRTIDMNDFGIPQDFDRWSGFASKVLWTFQGRLRLNSEICKKVDTSHLYLHHIFSTLGWNYLVQKEAMEISRRYTYELGSVVEQCCLYLLSLRAQGGNIMEDNLATHASNYWVCDGIIEGGQADKAWEVAATLHQEIHMDYYSSDTDPFFGMNLVTPPKRWIFASENSSFFRENSSVHPDSTSFFLPTSIYGPPLRLLRNGMFHQANKLRVLKLCHCTFKFSLPPFRYCRNLRFLGLDGCKDQGGEGVDNQDILAMDLFKSLWVLDICHTDWELDLSPEIIDQIAANMREININNGRFWHVSFAWRKLKNLHKLRVIDPTRSWEMGGKDGFTVLPSLSTSNSLKTLVLDGCLGLEHVEGLPLTLESFSLYVRPRKEARTICISMAGCARLSEFKLLGSLPKLEELDLSGTKVKTLDLTTKVVQVPRLQRVMLLGCEQLRAVLWPEKWVPQLRLLHIDTRARGKIERISPDLHKLKMGYGQVYFAMVDMKFIQLLFHNMYWNIYSSRFRLNLCISSSGLLCNNEKMGSESSARLCMPPSLIPEHCYTSVATNDITIDHVRDKSEVQFRPWGYHVEIGEGISNTSMTSIHAIKSVIFVMNKAESLHVHDNSSITTVIPENMTSIVEEQLSWTNLKQCYVMRCPKMHAVFNTNYESSACFNDIVTFWAADLLIAQCIWSTGRTLGREDDSSFRNLRSIHIYSCPRLTFVLPLSWATRYSYLPNLETLHIINCGDLKGVFPMEPEIIRKIVTDYREGVLEFPKLKQMYLHELPKLHYICETKMSAPMLETIRLRGCWSLRRLPSVVFFNRPCAVVDCEKEWWEKLEWDGIMAVHDPSLYAPRHSSYYKEPLPRVSVLR